jgi:hypothetical protein
MPKINTACPNIVVNLEHRAGHLFIAEEEFIRPISGPGTNSCIPDKLCATFRDGHPRQQSCPLLIPTLVFVFSIDQKNP